jgi:predicted adenylyl cyclase CyaB
MARNIEIKVRVANIEALSPKAAEMADHGPIEIRQDDTYFFCRNGRLKLRSFSPTEGELIFYQRSDQPGPKESFYLMSSTTTPDNLREILSLVYGQIGLVRKHRTLFLVGRTRIHLDRVEGLGDFLEIEVVLAEGESLEAGKSELNQLLVKFDITPGQLVGVSYLDLLAERKNALEPENKG